MRSAMRPMTIVGDQHGGCGELAVDPHNRLQYKASGLMIQGAGGLIAEQQLWPLDDRARDGDPLLLPARELCRKVVESLRESNPGERVLRLHRVSSDFGHERNILAHRQTRNQIVELKYEPNVFSAKARQLGLASMSEIVVVPERTATGGRIEASQNVSGAPTSRCRTGQQDDQLSGIDVQIDLGQRVHRDLTHHVVLGKATRG